MTSQVSIVNKALILLGEATIISMDDPVKAARVMKALYEVTRDSELRKNRWNFAMKRAQLSPLADTPSWGYLYQYQLPADCLRLDMIKDSYVIPGLENYREQENQLYAIEGRRILTDLQGPLSIRYIYQVTDTNEFDALFVESFARKLAFETAETITQSTQKKEMAWREYQMALREAVKVGAIEKPPEPMLDSSWTVGRL